MIELFAIIFKKRFKNLKKSSTSVTKDYIILHHMPSAAYMKKYGVNYQEGIVITVANSRHRDTRTYGIDGSKSTLQPRDELAADIHDMRKIYQKDGVYNSEIRDGLLGVSKQNQAKFPEIFEKGAKK
jgi:hypothetical protein